MCVTSQPSTVSMPRVFTNGFASAAVLTFARPFTSEDSSAPAGSGLRVRFAARYLSRRIAKMPTSPSRSFVRCVGVQPRSSSARPKSPSMSMSKPRSSARNFVMSTGRRSFSPRSHARIHSTLTLSVHSVQPCGPGASLSM